jgi:hypothetical protein
VVAASRIPRSGSSEFFLETLPPRRIAQLPAELWFGL